MVNIRIWLKEHSQIKFSKTKLLKLHAIKSMMDIKDIDKYKYSGYGIGIDEKETSTHAGNGFCQNIIIFGDDLISSVRPNNKRKTNLFLVTVLRKD